MKYLLLLLLITGMSVSSLSYAKTQSEINTNQDLKSEFSEICSNYLVKAHNDGASEDHIETVAQDCDKKIQEISNEDDLTSRDLSRVSEYQKLKYSKEARESLKYRLSKRLYDKADISFGFPSSSSTSAAEKIVKPIALGLLPFAVIAETIILPITAPVDFILNEK